MPNGTYGGVRGRRTKVGRKLLRFPPTRFISSLIAKTAIMRRNIQRLLSVLTLAITLICPLKGWAQ